MQIKNLLFITALCLMVLSSTAQTTTGGKDKKMGQEGVGMNKSENKMTVRSTLSGAETGYTVKTGKVEKITAATAFCGYSIKMRDSQPLAEFGICWGKSQAPTIADSKSVQTVYSENNQDGEISNLEPDTKYYVRAFLTTVNGTQYGNEEAFTTLSATPKSTYFIRRR